MIRNTFCVFLTFSNNTSISALNQLRKNHLKNLWQVQNSHYTTYKNPSSVYADKLSQEGVRFDLITKGDPVLEKRLKLIVLEIENERYNGNPVPEKIEIRDYFTLMSIEDASDRKIYLTQLSQNVTENRTKNVVTESDENDNPYLIHNHIYYSLDRNSMFNIDSMKNSHCMLDCVANSGLMYGDNIVIDFSYENVMKPEELQKCAYQIVSTIYDGRLIVNPFNIHLCNVQMNGTLMRMLKSILKRAVDQTSVHVHRKSYLDIFDRNQLIYLSPDAKDELVEYDPDKVYIIGGLVDREPVYTPYSLDKIKSEDIVARRFPVSEYFDLNLLRGTQSFGINTTFRVLAAMSYFKDWSKAFQYLPKRFTRKPKYEKTEYKWRNLHSLLDDS